MFVHVETTLLQATRMSQYKTQALRKKAGKKKGDKKKKEKEPLLPLGLPSADLRQTAHVRRTLILETLAKARRNAKSSPNEHSGASEHPSIASALHVTAETWIE